MNSDAFDLLAKQVGEIARTRFGSPTQIQSLVIPKVLEGKNLLVISETGSGKTESVLLPIMSRLSQAPHKPISIIYITPLRSLNRDMLQRMQWWAGQLDFDVSVRHADTTQYERKMQSQNPADMLITTPETLQAILVGKLMRAHLANVRYVIIDEVHELAASKRASSLCVALERLKSLVASTGASFNVVGLSATIGNPQQIMQMIKADEVVFAEKKKQVQIHIRNPKPSMEDEKSADDVFVTARTRARLGFIREHVKAHGSSLIFTNTRQMAEALSSRLKSMGMARVETHHSSLSKEVRMKAEDDFKAQKLDALICTSSLELGIDIGSIDFIIQYGSPRQVSKLLQRVGRAGHSIDRTSVGYVIPLDEDDFFECFVIAGLARSHQAEDIRIVHKPLDILAHQIAGLALERYQLPFGAAYDLIKSAYPFRSLTPDEMFQVCLFMHKLGLISLLDASGFVRQKPASLDGLLIRRRSKTFTFYNENLSAIPDSRTYLLIDSISNKAVAGLDAQFVAANVVAGSAIIVKGQGWKVLEISENKITAEPLSSISASLPAWEGQLIPVPFRVAQGVGALRRSVFELSKKGSKPADDSVFEDMAALVADGSFSDDSLVLAEYGGYDSQYFLVINTCFGSRINETISRALAAVVADKVGSVGLTTDPYRMIFKLRQLGDWKDIVDAFLAISPDSLEKILSFEVPSGDLFLWHASHVAKRFGVISKDADFGKGYLRKVLKAYRDTPVYNEALSELFFQKLDVPAAVDALERIRNGSIKVQVKSGLSKLSLVGIDRGFELVAAQRPESEIFDMFKRRLLETNGALVCINCARVHSVRHVKDLQPDACASCSSQLLAYTPASQAAGYCELLRRNLQGRQLSADEQKSVERLLDSASLIVASGPDAIKVLAARGIGTKTASRILAKMLKGDELYMEILKAERQYVRTRGFWA